MQNNTESSPPLQPSNSRRRVPDQLRKRAAVSCDFCKIRRRKCVRSVSKGPCKLCKENDIRCVATISRKPRSHAAVGDDLPRSYYRAMEDLINTLFPALSTGDTEELLRLTKAVENGSVTFFRNQSPSGVLDTSNTTSSPAMPYQSPLDPSKSPSPPPEHHCTNPHIASVYERMLQNPSGTLSFFGPSSSMAYVRQMRELLSALGARQDASPVDTQRLRDKFIADKYAHTMGEGQDSISDIRALDCLQQIGGAFDAQRPTAAASARLAKLLEILPEKEETEELVELFFLYVHANIPLFHRSSLQGVMDQLRSPDRGAIDVGWAVCIRLVVTFGCEWRLSSPVPVDESETTRLALLRKQLVSDSLEEVSQLMLSSTLQSVAALALFSVYLSFANERNAAWILSGSAIRMAIGLGLHRGEDLIQRSNIQLSLADKELRKQIWCSLYIFEQYTSSLFGRPSAVDGIEILVDLPKESIFDQSYYQPPGLLSHDISLARILSKIRRVQLDHSLYPSNDCQGLPDVNACNELLRELSSWEENLPPFLRFDESKSHQIYPNHLRQIIMMHVRYQYSRTLLSRPFLLKALYISHVLKPRQVIEEQITKFKQVCFLAALASWTLIHYLWKNGLYNAKLWLDGVFAYQCTLVLSLCMLDGSILPNNPQQDKLQQTVEQLQEILQKGPGNRTMSRLVQICHDFTKIVKSSPLSYSELQENYTGLGASAGPAQDPSKTPLNQTEAQSDLNTTSTSSNIPIFHWESLVGPDWFQGDFMDDTYRFDMSMTDFFLDGAENSGII